MKQVALYARVSTATQGTGLESQILALMSYCRAHNLTGEVLYQDEAISGAKTRRPGLDRLMDDARSKAISTVIVYSFSRFARSTSHLLAALKEFSELGVAFISISERIDTTTPMGKMVFTICAAVAELERELVVERVKAGLNNARSKGRQLGRPRKRNEELIIRLFQQGLTYREIARLAQCAPSTVSETIRSIKQSSGFSVQKAEIG